ncbi:hypothetical protein U0868_00250 [Kluyvera ascorbata]|uniref:hypothetical protein n=1 Tax=Kluyvera ascorbata TaxID=51288 RepID=UPI002ABC123B|nr:hypothetical protein [Kluyvera ascorbata]MDZ4029987.1 hypothetical protein [Kluyvera ascorbata]
MSQKACPLCGETVDTQEIFDTKTKKSQMTIYHCPTEGAYAVTPYLDLWLKHEVGEPQKSMIRSTVRAQTSVTRGSTPTQGKIPLYSSFEK